MMQCVAYPLQLVPVYMDYIWGGNRMATDFGRSGTPSPCAESWEVADRPEGMSIVQNGPLAGKTLHELVCSCGTDLVGTKHVADRFPLLIKLIDARARLSLQVHPNDANADACGGEPKTEVWHILDADAGAGIFAGLREPTTRDAFRAAVEGGEAESRLAFLPAAKGDTIYIPGGRVHAIGEGCLLLEVQQNSNTTYRVYDWGRVGNDGRPRELHMDKALQVIDWSDARAGFEPSVKTSEHDGNTWWKLVSSPYFQLNKVRLTSPEHVLQTQDSFTVLFLASGSVAVSVNGMAQRLSPGTSCLIPAAAESYDLIPSGASDVITIRS